MIMELVQQQLQQKSKNNNSVYITKIQANNLTLTAEDIIIINDVINKENKTAFHNSLNPRAWK